MKTWILAVSALLACTGCSKKDNWYEVSSSGKEVNDDRVEQFKMQGMDEVKAKQTMIFETYWRNTEIGHRKDDPVQGNDLQDALNRPAQ